MCESPIISAAHRFLEAVMGGEAPSDGLLLKALDGLLVAYHDLPDHFPADYAEPPERDWKALYREFQLRFPDLGLYPVCDPAQEPGVEQIMVGDAIDDLTDITLDMRDVIWLADNAGEDAAHHAYGSLYPPLGPTCPRTGFASPRPQVFLSLLRPAWLSPLARPSAQRQGGRPERQLELFPAARSRGYAGREKRTGDTVCPTS